MNKTHFLHYFGYKLLLTIGLCVALTACGGDDNDEPEVKPSTATLSVKMQSITLGYEAYEDLCIGVIKSSVSQPVITIDTEQDWISAQTVKLSDKPVDGMYTFLIYADIDENKTGEARDFKIKTTASCRMDDGNGNSSSASGSGMCANTQFPKEDTEYINNYICGKWRLTKVNTLNNLSGDFTSEQFTDNKQLTFNANGSGNAAGSLKSEGFPYSGDFSYMISGNKLLIYNNSFADLKVTYVVSNLLYLEYTKNSVCYSFTFEKI